ncbi:wall-associated receptor kinase-like 14 [Cucurbita maxima]|uniref:Wall-associated receptor kinase-like 14 n=1 Tax=Cucurbita maxima TaxID=3661 RepID=A0A6J1KMP4_CUCMA|nr:wall-associated receptor kinase-like 14 [Cucurbita maxima]
MISKTQFLNFTIFLLILILTAKTEAKCSKSCTSGHLPHDFPYPFGFSADCLIRLNCTHDGAAMIGEFPVESINSDHIKLVTKAKCNRRLHTIRQFFSHHYAPTVNNAILLQNCSSPIATCFLPTTMVQTKFESPPNCSVNRTSISCYTQNATATATAAAGFLDFKNLTATNCDYLLSSISAEALALNSNASAGISLEIQTLELGWWLPGSCRRSCHVDANCTELRSPGNGELSHRCRCRDELVGDGYLAGTGCRKASNCYTTNYIIGECRISTSATRTAILIGTLIGGATVLVTVCFFCYFIRRRSNLKSTHIQKITKRRLSEATAGKSPIHIYTYKEIQKATQNFSNDHRLGTGAYATVYAGKLRSDKWVAIKRLKNQDPDTIQQVLNEISLISSVSHPNLVRLLGCSMESGDQILVYEFMPNGTLSQHLQKQRGTGLPWPVRLDIAVETADAIAHLHSAINPPIFHRDIKSSNILLDQNLKSKVADFGLSRLGMAEISHISTAPQGTPGYLDPQYHQDFHLSDKSDVYSFGVVLVELITAMKVVDFCRPKNEINLAALAADKIGSGRLREIVDPLIEIDKDEWRISSVEKVGEVAFRCLAFHRDMRPSMVEVAAELDEIRRRRWEEAGLKCKEMGLVVESESSKSSHGGGDYFSRASVEDSWQSEQSSPSSSSLLNHVIL